jgi:predicted nuclease of predicted toxin-antitoxin system
MSKSSYCLLLDENVERRAMCYLEKRSHDAEMVVDVLEPQATDDEVQQYAEETNRPALTSDQNFLARDYPTLFPGGRRDVGVRGRRDRRCDC